MNGVPFPIGPGVLALVALASVWDLHTRRIPNGLVLAGLAGAIAVQWMLHGPLKGLEFALFGCLVGGALLLPGYALGLMGAGDVKLMGAVGAFCGALGAFEIVLATWVIGGVWSLGTMLARRQARRGVQGAASILMTLGTSSPGGGETEHKVAAHSMGTLPYGVAIALGTVFVLFASA